MRKSIIIFISVFTLTFSLKAQDGIENILYADIADANKITEAYMNPAMKGLIYGMNSGWYHTAKVHKTLGFDISIGLNASMIPSKDEMFTISGLTSINQPTGSITSATVAGSENDGSTAVVTTTVAGQPVTKSFTLPGGVKEDLPLNAIPTPAIQVSLGLPAKFEASLRLVPEVGNEAKGSLLGLGLKKEITDWFGPLDKTPLHVTLMGAFTNMKVQYAIDDPSGNDINITDGNMEFKLNSYTVQAIASLNFPIVNLYGGVGYTGGSSTLKMLGTYEIDYDTTLPNTEKTLVNPLNLGFDASGFRTTVGARLSLGFFKIYADYTLQEYNTLSAGIAFSVR